jgi:N-acetyl-alpha-D-muramate 1-phosphate uridylyltransferase
MLPVVILAGGLATRLYPATLKIPKSLIEIDGYPFIHHQLMLIKEKGITDVILCVGRFGEMIETYVGDGSRYGLAVTYSYDGDVLLGTGGAIKKATLAFRCPFLIQYGDSYLDIDLKPVIQRYHTEKRPVLMTIYRNQNAFDTSNIIVKDGRILKYDKTVHDPAMEYIDYGLIVMQKEILDTYPRDEPFDLSGVLSKSVDSGLVSLYEAEQRFYEIGSVQGIKETGEYIRNRMLST